MISAVATELISGVAATIVGIGRRKATQSVGSQKMLLHGVDDLPGAFGAQHGMGQAHGQNLVGADTWIGWSAIHDVMQAAELLVPQQAIETPLGERGHVVEFLA